MLYGIGSDERSVYVAEFRIDMALNLQWFSNQKAFVSDLWWFAR